MYDSFCFHFCTHQPEVEMQVHNVTALYQNSRSKEAHCIEVLTVFLAEALILTYSHSSALLLKMGKLELRGIKELINKVNMRAMELLHFGQDNFCPYHAGHPALKHIIPCEVL